MSPVLCSNCWPANEDGSNTYIVVKYCPNRDLNGSAPWIRSFCWVWWFHWPGSAAPKMRGFFQSVCPVYGGLLRVFLCLKDKILFESTSCPSFAGMVLVDISWYSNKLPTNHWPPVTWKISKCHDLKADFHLPAGFTAFSLWNTVSHLAWGQYLKQPEEANGKEIFRQAQFFQRLLEFGAASFSVFFPVWKPLHHEHHESNPRCLLSMLEGHKAY